MSMRAHDVSVAAGQPGAAEEHASASGDFLAVYDEHARPLLAWLATRVPGSDLEDVHQEIWVKVWARKATSFKGGNFRAWLFTVARNHLIDRHEKKPATPLMQDPDEARVDAGQRTPLEIAVDHERRELLAGGLARLSDVRRRVMQMRLAGLGYEAISAELGITTPQAHSHFFAAKRELQDMLGEE